MRMKLGAHGWSLGCPDPTRFWAVLTGRSELLAQFGADFGKLGSDFETSWLLGDSLVVTSAFVEVN